MKLQTTQLLVLLFLTLPLFSQEEDRYNRFSAEAGIGVHVPLAPNEFISRSNYVSLGHTEIGLRYMFNQKLGLKLAFANNRFRDQDNSDLGINYNRIGIQAHYNLGRLLLPYYIYNKVAFFGHAGVSYARASPVKENFSEQTGTLSFGLKPQVKITDRISLFADGSYNFNFKQHYSYSGQLLSPDYQDQMGSFSTLSFGVIFNLGNKKHHADWY